jgi:hypothetical protein
MLTPRAASIACITIGLPAMVWSTLGKSDFMRVPCPAARITAATDIKRSFKQKRPRHPQHATLAGTPRSLGGDDPLATLDRNGQPADNRYSMGPKGFCSTLKRVVNLKRMK